MAADLKMEIFSVDVYRILWYNIGVRNFILPRFKKYDVSDEIKCSDAVLHAIECRRCLFHFYLHDKIYFDYEDYSNSSFDFYLYIQNNMDTFLTYKELSIFDKLLMVCTVILEMGYTCNAKSDTMFLYNCPLCFAMYFDSKYKEEFYAEGGWSALEIHANAYQARALTQYLQKEIPSSSFILFSQTMFIDYSFEFVNRTFKEKCIDRKTKTCCPQCLPLFHVIKKQFGSSELITEFQLAEGYLQIILRTLSSREWIIETKRFIRVVNLKQTGEALRIINRINAKTQQKSVGAIPDEEYFEFLNEYKDHITRVFSARLFQAHDDTVDQCMFCARNVNELLKVSVSDIRVERIKFVINETVNLKREQFSFNKKRAADIDINAVLKLFLSLGVEPLKTNILENLKKSKLHKNAEKLVDSLATMKNQKDPDDQVKKNKGKRKKIK